MKGRLTSNNNYCSGETRLEFRFIEGPDIVSSFGYTPSPSVHPPGEFNLTKILCSRVTVGCNFNVINSSGIIEKLNGTVIKNEPVGRVNYNQIASDKEDGLEKPGASMQVHTQVRRYFHSSLRQGPTPRISKLRDDTGAGQRTTLTPACVHVGTQLLIPPLAEVQSESSTLHLSSPFPFQIPAPLSSKVLGLTTRLRLLCKK